MIETFNMHFRLTRYQVEMLVRGKSVIMLIMVFFFYKFNFFNGISHPA